jgi:hypothetical protein
MTQPQTAQEVVFYQDASPVYISSTRAILLNQTYILRNVASVSMERTPRKHSSEIVLLIMGLVIGYIGVELATKYTSYGTASTIWAVLFLLVSIALIIRGIYQFLKGKPLYALVVGVPMPVKTIVSENPDYITMLVNTLNTALTYRV